MKPPWKKGEKEKKKKKKKNRKKGKHMSRLMTNPTKWLCTQRRLRPACISAQFDQSLRCPHEENLGPLLPIERTAKTLIRLGGCPGWFESSLGVHSLRWFCHVAAHILSIIHLDRTTGWNKYSDTREDNPRFEKKKRKKKRKKKKKKNKQTKKQQQHKTKKQTTNKLSII